VAVPSSMLEDNSQPFESVILDSMNVCRYMQTLLIVSRCLLSNVDHALSIRQQSLTRHAVGDHGSADWIEQLLEYRKSLMDEI